MKKTLLILLFAFVCVVTTTSAKVSAYVKKAGHINNHKQAIVKKQFNPAIGNIILSDWGGGELYMYVPSYDVTNVVSYSWSISPYTGYEVLSAYPDYQLNVYGLSSNTHYTITITGLDANNNSVSSSVNYYHSGAW